MQACTVCGTPADDAASGCATCGAAFVLPVSPPAAPASSSAPEHPAPPAPEQQHAVQASPLVAPEPPGSVVQQALPAPPAEPPVAQAPVAQAPPAQPQYGQVPPPLATPAQAPSGPAPVTPPAPAQPQYGQVPPPASPAHGQVPPPAVTRLPPAWTSGQPAAAGVPPTPAGQPVADGSLMAPAAAPASPLAGLAGLLRMDEVDLRTVLRGTGLLVAGYLAVCTVLAATLTVLATEDGEGGGLVLWFKLGVLLAGAGVHAPVFAELVANVGGGTGTLTVTPLLLTGALVVGGAVIGRREERATPSQSFEQALRRSAAGGVATGLALALVAAVSRLRDGFGESIVGLFDIEGGVVIGVSAFRFAVLAALVTFLALALGRLGLLSRATRAPAAARLSALSRGVTSWVPSMALHLVLTALLVVCMGLAYVLLSSEIGVKDLFSDIQDEVDSAALTFLAVLLFLPNVLLGAAAAAMGMSVGGSAGSDSDIGGGSADGGSFGLLEGPPAGLYVLVLAPLLAAAVVGVRQALREVPGTPVKQAWWRGAFGALLVWLPLGWFTHVSGGGQGGTDLGIGEGSAGLDAGIGVGSLLLLPFAWGALTLALGRLLARPVAATFPYGARRLGGAGTHPAWDNLLSPITGRVPATEHPLPEGVAPLRHVPGRGKNLLVRGGAALGVLVVLTVAYQGLSNTVFGPRPVVDGYLDALQGGDVEAAVSATGSKAKGPLLVAAALPEDRRIKNVKVTSTERSGDSAYVSVRYTAAGQPQEEQYSLVKDGRRALIFPKWRLQADLPQMSLSISTAVSQVLVNGVKVPVTGGELSAAALPGVYSVELPEDSVLSGSVNGVVVTQGGGQGVLEVSVSLRAISAAQEAVQTYLADCLKARPKDSLDEACGVRFYGYADSYEDVTMSVTTPPTMEVQVDDQGGLRADTDEEGTALVKGVSLNTSFFDSTVTKTPFEDEGSINLSGLLTFSGGTATFMEDSGEGDF